MEIEERTAGDVTTLAAAVQIPIDSFGQTMT